MTEREHTTRTRPGGSPPGWVRPPVVEIPCIGGVGMIIVITSTAVLLLLGALP